MTILIVTGFFWGFTSILLLHLHSVGEIEYGVGILEFFPACNFIAALGYCIFEGLKYFRERSE